MVILLQSSRARASSKAESLKARADVDTILGEIFLIKFRERKKPVGWPLRFRDAYFLSNFLDEIEIRLLRFAAMPGIAYIGFSQQDVVDFTRLPERAGSRTLVDHCP